jgi:arginase
MNINMIGVPVCFGSDRHGVNLGPEKLREKEVLNIIKKHHHTIYDLGNIYVRRARENEKYRSHEKMKYFDDIIEIDTNLAQQVYNTISSGNFPFVVGGDHSLGLGSIAGASRYFENMGVIWIDAHGDINTHETTPTGNVHGMPLAAAMGIGHEKLVNLYYNGAKVNPENVFIIGARDLDKGEIELAGRLNLNLWTTKKIKENGVSKAMKEIMERIKDKGIKHCHLSFDIDCLDKSLVPGTGTPVAEGLDLDETKYILKTFMESKLITSMDFVELNTVLDKEDITADRTIGLIDWTFKYLQ